VPRWVGFAIPTASPTRWAPLRGGPNTNKTNGIFGKFDLLSNQQETLTEVPQRLTRKASQIETLDSANTNNDMELRGPRGGIRRPGPPLHPEHIKTYDPSFID
jgi:hypothetical protein